MAAIIFAVTLAVSLSPAHSAGLGSRIPARSYAPRQDHPWLLRDVLHGLGQCSVSFFAFWPGRYVLTFSRNRIFAVIVNALIAVMVIFEGMLAFYVFLSSSDVILVALTIIYFFKNRSVMRRASNRSGSSNTSSSSSTLQSQSLSIALRLTLFTVFPMVALSVSMIASFVGPSYWSREVIAWINLCAAVFPLLVGIIFGSQKVGISFSFSFNGLTKMSRRISSQSGCSGAKMTHRKKQPSAL
jgi:hypothetical protein